MNELDKTKSNKKLSIAGQRWLRGLLLKPKKTVNEIATHDKPAWLLPLIILSVLVIILALLSAPVKKQAIEMGTNLPPDFEFYPPEMQTQILEARKLSPLHVFPVLFVPWVLDSGLSQGILHLVLLFAAQHYPLVQPACLHAAAGN